MEQSERDEEAREVKEYEEMRANGVSLTEIGAGRAKGVEKPDVIGGDTMHIETVDEKKGSRYIAEV